MVKKVGWGRGKRNSMTHVTRDVVCRELRRCRGKRRRLGMRLLLAAVGAALLLLSSMQGLRYLNVVAQRQIAARERYQRDFQAIECPCPPGLDRQAFLAEVQYQAAAPTRFSILQPDWVRMIRAAFAAHPWVEQVVGVEARSTGPVRVALRFRQPVLRVRTTDGSTQWVDGQGVLLPPAASPLPGERGLPMLLTPRPRPSIGTGQRWEDPLVLRALELVRAYQPLQLSCQQGRWELRLADDRLLYVAAARTS